MDSNSFDFGGFRIDFRIPTRPELLLAPQIPTEDLDIADDHLKRRRIALDPKAELGHSTFQSTLVGELHHRFPASRFTVILAGTSPAVAAGPRHRLEAHTAVRGVISSMRLNALCTFGLKHRSRALHVQVHT